MFFTEEQPLILSPDVFSIRGLKTACSRMILMETSSCDDFGGRNEVDLCEQDLVAEELMI